MLRRWFRIRAVEIVTGVRIRLVAAATICTLVASMPWSAFAQSNQPPDFPSTETGVRSVAEDTGPGVDIGAPFQADDPDDAVLTYSIGGVDADAFTVVAGTGQLQTSSGLNYEAKSTYRLSVTATDPMGASDSINVVVNITNVEEAGIVSFVRQANHKTIRVHLRDPDGGVSGATWTWARSVDGLTAWTDITTTSTSYTPGVLDSGKYLRATVTYTDTLGAGKEAKAVYNNLLPAPEIRVATVVSGLTIPWDMAFTPDGTMLFTQRSGSLSSRLTNGVVQTVDADFGDLFASGETGLMSIAVDPEFGSNRRFYTCQGHTGPEVQVIAWTIDSSYAEATRVADPLVGGIPTGASGRHGGCRLRFGPDGYLWITTGDGGRGTNPQDLASLGGKVLRVDKTTGLGAPGNPFPSSRVYTFGHRNVQGLDRRPGTNEMWSVEHGPTFDDEINLLVAGGNYGWDPTPGYNERLPMTDLTRFPDAVEAKWSSGSSTLATSGGTFLSGSGWGIWEGRLAVATLRAQNLYLFEFDAAGELISMISLPELAWKYGRLRTPVLGPDGALYVSTSGLPGTGLILRVAEKQAPDEPRMGQVTSRVDQLVVNWDSPTDDGGGEITGYDLRYIRSDATDKADIEWALVTGAHGPGSGPFAYTLGSLENGVSYDLQVRAVNSEGVGQWSRTVQATTALPNHPPVFSSDTAVREIGEDHMVGGKVGAPVVATDPERDTLTYTLDVSSEYFDLASATGQLTTRAELDFETDSVHDLTILVSDGKDENGETDPSSDDTIDVTVNVTDVNEPPALDGPVTVDISEGAERRLATYSAVDPEQASIAWSVAGTDAADVEIDNSGELSLRQSPDYEGPQDANRDNRYQVEVRAYDGMNRSTLDVTVTVGNVDEPGAITLSSIQPQVGTSMVATLSDPDGGVSGASWQWFTSTDQATWSSITGAVRSGYTPVVGDEGAYLQVTVSYNDGEGQGKNAEMALASTVRAAPVTNSPPEFPSTRVQREVSEGAPSGRALGAPVAASDPDGDKLLYTLDKNSDAVFDIDEATGQLSTEASLDHESRATYNVKVTATDPSLSKATTTVAVTITDEDEPPVLSGPGVVFVPHNTRNTVATYRASDPEGATLTWTLSSPDLSLRLAKGVLSFPDPAEYQPDSGNTYYITIEVSDQTYSTLLPVTIMVTEVSRKTPPPPTRSGGGGSSDGGGSSGGGGGGGGGPPTPTASERFEDVPSGAGYESAVSWMVEHQITVGCTRTLFCPDADLTRQQFVTFLWRAAGEPTATYRGSEAFADVVQGVYSDEAIGWAVSNGVTVGCTEGEFGDTNWRFCPGDPVTRGQMATFLYRHVDSGYPGRSLAYTDVDADAYYWPSVSWLTEFGAAPGCDPGRFCPDRDATRVEAAVFIHGVAIRPGMWGPGNTSFIPSSS